MKTLRQFRIKEYYDNVFGLQYIIQERYRNWRGEEIWKTWCHDAHGINTSVPILYTLEEAKERVRNEVKSHTHVPKIIGEYK